MERKISYGEKQKLTHLGYDVKQQVAGNQLLSAWETLEEATGLSGPHPCLSADGIHLLGAQDPVYLNATCRPVYSRVRQRNQI